MDANQVIKILNRISNGELLTSQVQDVDPFFDFIEQSETLMAAYQNAQKRRARVFLEQAITTAMKAEKMTAASDKLLVDTLKWAALVADPQTFSGKVLENVGDTGPYTIITGVPDADSSLDGVQAPNRANPTPPENETLFGAIVSPPNGEDSMRDKPSDRPRTEE